MVDYEMPKMTGIQFAERIKLIDPQNKIMLCTGYVELSQKNSKFIDYYVGKPINKALILEIANKLKNNPFLKI